MCASFRHLPRAAVVCNLHRLCGSKRYHWLSIVHRNWIGFRLVRAHDSFPHPSQLLFVITLAAVSVCRELLGCGRYGILGELFSIQIEIFFFSIRRTNYARDLSGSCSRAFDIKCTGIWNSFPPFNWDSGRYMNRCRNTKTFGNSLIFFARMVEKNFNSI